MRYSLISTIATIAAISSTVLAAPVLNARGESELDSRSTLTLPKKKVGESCSDTYPCEAGLDCVETKNGKLCVKRSTRNKRSTLTLPKKKLGEGCSATYPCEAGLACVETKNGHVCVKRSTREKRSIEAIVEEIMARDELEFETRSTLTLPKKKVGEGCSSTYPCEDGLDCVETKNGHVCVKRSTRNKRSVESIEEELIARDELELQSRSTLTLPKKKLGEGCSTTYPCEAGLACVETKNGHVCVKRSTREKRSVESSEDQLMARDNESELEARSPSTLTLPKKKVGESCSDTYPCEAGLDCVETKKGKLCVKRSTRNKRSTLTLPKKKLGEGCSTTYPCEAGLACVETKNGHVCVKRSTREKRSLD